MINETVHQVAMQIAVTLIIIRLGFIAKSFIQQPNKNPAS